MIYAFNESVRPPENPVSILQMHPVVKVCLDEASAGEQMRTDYFRWVYANKPHLTEILSHTTRREFFP